MNEVLFSQYLHLFLSLHSDPLGLQLTVSELGLNPLQKIHNSLAPSAGQVGQILDNCVDLETQYW